MFFRLFFVLLVFWGFQAWAQEKPTWSEEDKKKVLWPLDFRSPISGTFAEIRNHSLHMGADFKSYGMNGHSVVAVFDGWVEDIHQSQIGYGLSVHLNSPEMGLRAKYAHLMMFEPHSELEKLRHSLELLANGKDFQIKLEPKQYYYTANQPLARTGESGTGPSHLHLEFRHRIGIVNPLSFPAYQDIDSTPPTILSLILEPSIGSTEFLRPEKVLNNLYKLNPDKPIEMDGRVRIKLGGFDYIKSRNKNNVYGYELKINGKSVYSRFFDFVSYEEYPKKWVFYDVNRSTLSPPIYYYNLFPPEPNQDFSIDLTHLKEGDIIPIQAILHDANENDSTLSFELKKGSPPKTLKIQPTKPTMKLGIVTSPDKMVSLDFRNKTVYGTGTVEIQKWSKANLEDLKFPKGLGLVSPLYKIQANGINWMGETNGEFAKLKLDPGVFLYLYEEDRKRWSLVTSKKNGDNVSFQLSRLGILAALKDTQAPVIYHPFHLTREGVVEKVRNPHFAERYYAISDLGSGFRRDFVVTVDGQNYPFTYDPDRKAIHLEFPKKIKNFRKYILVQIEAKDYAGNESKVFTDLIRTKDW